MLLILPSIQSRLHPVTIKSWVDLALYASNKAMAEITDPAGKKIAVRAIVNFVAWLCQCGVPKTLEEPLKGEWPAS